MLHTSAFLEYVDKIRELRLNSIKPLKLTLNIIQLYVGSPETLLPGLLSWKEAQEPLHAYGALNFRAFLPPTEEWPLATPYFIVNQQADETQTHMNRYYPQPPPLNHALLHSLLAQFHPNVFLVTRFGPRGTVALVRAQNEHMLDIVIRYTAWSSYHIIMCKIIP